MMIGIGRKSISKWDKELPEISIGDAYKNAWSRRAGMFAYAKDSESRQRLPEIAGSFKLKRYDFEANSNNGRELSDDMIELDSDGNYSTIMSPGLDDWRQQQNHKCSPSGAWGFTYRSRSRSRSRTPSISLNPKLGTNHGDIRTKTCKSFSAGGCRNGDRCPYVHQYDGDFMARREVEDYRRDDWEGRHRGGETSNYRQSDRAKEQFMRNDRSGDLCSYFLEGKCHKGALCNYNHQGTSFDGICKGFENECFLGKGNDRANRHAAFDDHQDHETFRSGSIPCKYFAAGNCRNGKFCKFSHHHQMRKNPNAKLQGDWSQESNKSDKVQLLRDTHLDISELPEWDENRNGSPGVLELRGMVHFGNDRWEHSLDNQQRHYVYPSDCQRALESSDGEYFNSTAGNTGDGMGNEYRDVKNRHGVVRNSCVRNYVSPKMLNNIVQEECTRLNQASQPLTCETFSITCPQETQLGWREHEADTIKPMASENLMFQSNSSWREITASTLSHEDETTTSWGAKSSIDLNLPARLSPGQSQNENGQTSSKAAYVHSSNTAIRALSGINGVELVQHALPNTYREENSATTQNPLFFQVNKLLKKPCLVDTNNSELLSAIQSQNIVSREKLSHLTSVAATLAQLIRNGQQVPQIHAALNVSNAMEVIPSSVSDSATVGSSIAATSVVPNSVFERNKEYDPFCDSIEPIEYASNNPPAGFVSNCSKETTFADQNLSPSFEAVPIYHNAEGHQLNKADRVANHDVEGSDGMLDRGRNKKEENPLKKTREDVGVNECKKNNNGRVARAFKFALAECVKELLRPAWRDGQLSKEDHKTIVKKVVDKVTGSVQGAHIPQAQEKIDNYISSSRLKLSKLVQAYVKKYQKS